MTQIYIEKWVIFHINAKGDWDIALFSGEVQRGAKCFKLRVPVPAELVGQEIIADVERDDAMA